MKRKTMITLALLSALGASTAALAVDYPLPPANSRLIGQNQYWTVQEGDRNLQAIARHFDTAAMLILEANDTIAPVQPKPGTQVLIPSQMLLPDVPRRALSSTSPNCGCITSAGRESGAGLSAGHWPVRSGNAGDDHPRGAEDP